MQYTNRLSGFSIIFLTRVIPASLLLSLVTACSLLSRKGTVHPGYFDKVFARADSLRGIGDSLCMHYLDSAYAAFPGAGDLDLYRKYNLEEEMAAEDRLDFVTANQYADSMMLAANPYISDKQYRGKYALALFRKGSVMVGMGKYDEAVEFYSRGEDLVRNIPDSCMLDSRFSGQMGAVFYIERKYRKAIRYYRQTIGKLSDCAGTDAFDNFEYAQGMLDNIALGYRAMGKPDSALFYFQKGLDFIAQNQDRFPEKAHLTAILQFKSLLHGNMGDTYNRQGDYVQAERELIASLLPPGSFSGLDNSTLGLADLYLNGMNEREKAQSLLRKARAVLDSAGRDDTDELEWRRLESAYFDKTGDPAQAYRYYRSYISLKDSVDGNRRKFNGVDVDKRFEDMERKHELALLKKDNQLQKVYLLITIGVSIMAVIILLLIWLNWKRSRKNLYIIRLHNKHLEYTMESLEQRNRDYDHVVKVMAHDLRNPIGGISGMTNMLKDEETLTEGGQQMLMLILHSCNKVLSLIQDLLESKSTPDSRKLKLRLYDMSVLLTDCVTMLHFRSEEKKQQIRLGKIPASTVLMDQDKMWRVFNNLITNAIKFSPEKSVIRVFAEKKEGKLVICVADSGIGIPADMRDKVFDVFTMAGRTGTSGEKSFGLGLSICKQIVEAHGGSLWFESKVGVGTTFYVAMPVLAVVEAPPQGGH